MHLRKSQKWVKQNWSQQSSRWEAMVRINSTLLQQLLWWSFKKNTHLGVPLHPPTPVQDMFTDACDG